MPLSGNIKGIRAKLDGLFSKPTIEDMQQRKYRSKIQRLYDGPQGAAIRLSSLISLHEPLFGRLLKTGALNLQQYSRILDVGCGSGQVLRHLIRHTNPDAKIVACDMSHRMASRARSRLESDRIVFLTADITNLPFADNSCDCITCGWVIEYLPDPRPALAELRRVLKPEGSLFLMATENTIPGVISSRIWKCRTFNRSELRDACETVGLRWSRQIWLSPIHNALNLGGIFVEAMKSS